MRELVSSFYNVTSLVSFANKFHIPLPSLLKAVGYGYKVLGGLTKPISKQNSIVKTIILALSFGDKVKFLALVKELRPQLSIFKFRNWVLSEVASLSKRIIKKLLRNENEFNKGPIFQRSCRKSTLVSHSLHHIETETENLYINLDSSPVDMDNYDDDDYGPAPTTFTEPPFEEEEEYDTS